MSNAAGLRHRNPSYQFALGATPEIVKTKSKAMTALEEVSFDAIMIDEEEFMTKENMEDKLLTVVASVNAIVKNFKLIQQVLFHNTDGIEHRLELTTSQAEDTSELVGGMSITNKQSSAELEILKGLTQKHENDIIHLQDSVVDLVVRGMSSNIVVSGILDDTKEEDCVHTAMDFITEKMALEVNQSDILAAHRIGPYKGKDRQLLIKCTPDLKQKLLGNSKNLAEKKNRKEEYYYVNRQLPEKFVAMWRDNQDRIKKIKEENKSLPADKQIKYEVKDHVLYVNKEPQRKIVTPPKASELFAEKAEQEQMDRIKFTTSNQVSEKGSSFTATACKLSSIPEMRRAYRKVCQSNPSADHIVAVYVTKVGYGHQDDGEHGAGRRIAKLLSDRNANNIAVFVIRHYGSQHLGFQRHNLMEQTVKDILNQLKI